LGHPVDIEKLRQAAIEAAHLEGFNRSARDVTLRRLISFSISTMLKNAFEQVFSPPLIIESIFAQLGETPALDTLVRLHYDGDHHYFSSGVLVAHRDSAQESEAADWLAKSLKPEDSLKRVAELCMAAWQVLNEGKTFQGLAAPDDTSLSIPGKVLELALLDRNRSGPVQYRPLDLK
jgi:proteasome alpha subunit